jgi:UDP-N-acetylglucosamine 1-carboxyvinyltransferase
MDIKVKSGQVLSGTITPSGSKNSAVALIPATLLFDKTVTLHNIPQITDVETILAIIKKLGGEFEWDKKKKTIKFDNSKIRFSGLDEKDLGNLKGTSLFWGPMLARFKRVDFSSLPGGCTLGVRPLDTHYLAFRDLGVELIENRNSVKMDATRAKSSEIWLNEMSPTATENIIMFATGLKGVTRIVGAASEPQVQDLCEFLIKCGVHISGAGSNILEIRGAEYLDPKPHTLYSDHYEITTFLAMGAITGGEVRVENALPGKIANIINTFAKFGVEVVYEGRAAIVKSSQKIDVTKFAKNKVLDIKAQPWPGLPVDSLPLFIPLALASDRGQVLFHNWMYEAGLFWTSELTKLGANIVMGDPHRVLVTSGSELYAAKLEAPYIIRAVVAMVMAAMLAKGETTIINAETLYRGHPNFAENLRKLGAKIAEVAGS